MNSAASATPNDAEDQLLPVEPSEPGTPRHPPRQVTPAPKGAERIRSCRISCTERGGATDPRTGRAGVIGGNDAAMGTLCQRAA